MVLNIARERILAAEWQFSESACDALRTYLDEFETTTLEADVFEVRCEASVHRKGSRIWVVRWTQRDNGFIRWLGRGS